MNPDDMPLTDYSQPATRAAAVVKTAQRLALVDYARAISTQPEGQSLRALAADEGHMSIVALLRAVLARAVARGTEVLKTIDDDENEVLKARMLKMEILSPPKSSEPLRRVSSTRAKKELYLETLMDTGSMSKAIEYTGISQGLPYRWAIRDAEFKKAWNEARGYAGLEPLGAEEEEE